MFYKIEIELKILKYNIIYIIYINITMNTLYKQYIEMYGNFSHILNIKIDNRLSKDEKTKFF